MLRSPLVRVVLAQVTKKMKRQCRKLYRNETSDRKIDLVIAVGGSSRLECIRTCIKDNSGCSALCVRGASARGPHVAKIVCKS